MEALFTAMEDQVGEWIRETVAELYRAPFYNDELTDEQLAIREVLESLSTLHVLIRTLESNYRIAIDGSAGHP
jgi:hypothetical protein